MSTLNKGEQVMDGLLLSQYSNSPLLRQYLMAYVGEMDELFYNLEEVYYGRFLETAVGVQLDVIGIILQQDRNIDIQSIYFAFKAVIGTTLPATDGFGTIADTSEGGIFKSLYNLGASVEPLTDDAYRRVLQCKANLLNKDNITIEDIYEAVYIILGRVPASIEVAEPANLEVEVNLLSSDTRNDEYLLLLYMAKYFSPAAMTFSINLI